MNELTLKSRTVPAVDAVPDGNKLAVCSCGGTQFRLYEAPSGELFVTCPTCGTPFSLKA